MKVAIVGGSPSSEHLAPFDDSEWEIWVHGNQMHRHKGRRVSRIFEIHEDLSEHEDGYAEWLAGLGIPMIVSKKFPITADHIKVFPFSKAEPLLGGPKWASTPAYMMACAILEKATNIGIYGIDMAVDDHEYFHQRPNMYAWISFAMALGIGITIPPESPLFKTGHIEGITGNKIDCGLPPFTSEQFVKMAAIHKSRIDEYKQQIANLQVLINTHDGGRQAYERMAKVARAIESGQQFNSLTDTARIK